jgi:hypothetical protein
LSREGSEGDEGHAFVPWSFSAVRQTRKSDGSFIVPTGHGTHVPRRGFAFSPHELRIHAEEENVGSGTTKNTGLSVKNAG